MYIIPFFIVVLTYKLSSLLLEEIVLVFSAGCEMKLAVNYLNGSNLTQLRRQKRLEHVATYIIMGVATGGVWGESHPPKILKNRDNSGKLRENSGKFGQTKGKFGQTKGKFGQTKGKFCHKWQHLC